MKAYTSQHEWSVKRHNPVLNFSCLYSSQITPNGTPATVFADRASRRPGPKPDPWSNVLFAGSSLRCAHAYEDPMLDQGPIQRNHPIPHALAIHLHP